jgi:hypothetical protein
MIGMNNWSLGRTLFVVLVLLIVVSIAKSGDRGASQVNTQIGMLTDGALGVITDDAGQWAAIIRTNTLKFDLNVIGKGSVTVCHQGEYGPSCHGWTFNCRESPDLIIFARLDDGYRPSAYNVHDPSLLTKPQLAELAAMDAVYKKLPDAACALPDQLYFANALRTEGAKRTAKRNEAR